MNKITHSQHTAIKESKGGNYILDIFAHNQNVNFALNKLNLYNPIKKWDTSKKVTSSRLMASSYVITKKRSIFLPSQN